MTKLYRKDNPGWKVIDARTGLRVRGVSWADDETHEIGLCKCFFASEGLLTVRVRWRMRNNCDNPTAHPCPKVKIDHDHKTVLIHVIDLPDEEPDSEGTERPRELVPIDNGSPA